MFKLFKNKGEARSSQHYDKSLTIIGPQSYWEKNVTLDDRKVCMMVPILSLEIFAYL